MYDMTQDNNALQPMHDRAERPAYPSELQIRLTGDVLQKLALNAGDFQVGMELPISGTVLVTGISASPKQIAGTEQEVELQIIALDIGDEDMEDVPAEAEQAPLTQAERLFG